MPRDQWGLKREIIRHYDRLARVYDSLYGDEQKAKIESILKVLRLRPGDTVLDVGCGTGLLTGYVAGKVNHLVGIDLSGKSLKVAAERSRRLGIKGNVSLIKADADGLPFRDNTFSLIFALTLLQNVPEPRKTLREISRVAEEDSMFAVTGLKKHFTAESFDGLLRNPGWEHALVGAKETHDLIAVVKIEKVKNKYGQKEGLER